MMSEFMSRGFLEVLAGATIIILTDIFVPRIFGGFSLLIYSVIYAVVGAVLSGVASKVLLSAGGIGIVLSIMSMIFPSVRV